MNLSLNFGKSDKEKLKKFLSKFEKIETKTEFEEFRCKALDCIVTVYTSGKTVIQGNKSEEVKQLLLNEFELNDFLLLGIDETGRGEHTGPLTIAAVLGKTNSLRELRDSKKIEKLEEKYKIATKNSLANIVLSLNAKYVDQLRSKGFNLNEIEAKVVDKFSELFKEFEKNLDVKVDGNPFRVKDKKIEFLTKGDDLEPAIGAASVVAKFVREESGDEEERKTWNKKT